MTVQSRDTEGHGGTRRDTEGHGGTQRGTDGHGGARRDTEGHRGKRRSLNNFKCFIIHCRKMSLFNFVTFSERAR